MDTRRTFLKSAVSVAALAPMAGFPAIVKRRNANELLSHACVGTANMAMADLRGIMSHKDVHITALCDVDSNFLAAAHKLCPDARIYRNALEMFAAEGTRIDSVNVSTPDHTHAMYVLDALGRGLNVYAQKPLCHDLEDCRRIEALAAEKKAVTQMGTQIAAWECDRQTAAYLKSGVIGEVRHVWIFSNRGGQTAVDHTWPLKESPVPATLDWKTWLGKAPYRPYVEKVYHPFTWRRWRDFGTSWLGDLGLHLLSPVWIGMGLDTTGPVSVFAEVPQEPAEIRRQYWPRMSHIVWTMPGIKASGGKPFKIEWCDGNLADEKIKAATDPRYFPPAQFRELFAKSPIGEQPFQGRVVEGTEGWLLSVHYNQSPAVVLRKGGKPPPLPHVGPAPSHWHEWVNCCLQGGTPTSSFAWAGRLTEMVLLGNMAMLKPGNQITV
ncbi:MAG: Gfo/Idh/MocA family oxidoreductase [Kiritimatiellae bacterium]|nr:Gfo/Idh/MocA family oxidoreductase [Kiritimatiellia bacterium]